MVREGIWGCPYEPSWAVKKDYLRVFQERSLTKYSLDQCQRALDQV